MLLRFSVTNYACFDERAVLNMVASDDERLRDTHTIPGNPTVVRLAALYGANAAGKTRFTQALGTSRRIILGGTRPEQSIPVESFRLDRAKRKAPSTFEYVVLLGDEIWTYGLAVTRQRVIEEWLYLGPPDAESMLFERRGTDDAPKLTFGPTLAARDAREKADSRLEFLAEGTRPNQPFLTELRERNHPAVRELMAWFDSGLTVIQAAARYLLLEDRGRQDIAFIEALGGFLEAAGTGIDAIGVEQRPLDAGRIPAELVDLLRETAEPDGLYAIEVDGEYVMVHRDEEGALVHTRLTSQRRDDAGEPVRFEFADESAGTRQLMNLFPILADGGEAPRTIIVDELDRMLHPTLSRAVIDLFVRLAHPHSQLVFTTHESRLMNREVLRQDEIWVFSKTRSGGARLKPLSDYRVPADMDLDRAYLDGRFGGVPYLGRLDELGRK